MRWSLVSCHLAELQMPFSLRTDSRTVSVKVFLVYIFGFGESF